MKNCCHGAERIPENMHWSFSPSILTLESDFQMKLPDYRIPQSRDIECCPILAQEDNTFSWGGNLDLKKKLQLLENLVHWLLILRSYSYRNRQNK